MSKPLTKSLAVFSFLLFLVIQLSGQESIKISGTVIETETGETMIGATIYVPSLQLGTTTNEYGFYAFTLPKSDEKLQVVYSYIGFETITMDIVPDINMRLNVDLNNGINLEEVIVKANSFEEQLRSTQMSVERVNTAEVKLLPALLGEPDILKTIQLKPGIPSGTEGATGLFVRGGASDQNLIELDEAIVYNPNHLFGFFSTFNADAVKDLQLYKGGFPAEYGGRLSSIIDVKLKEGNNQKFSGSGGIGLISSRLTLEGPFKKGKSSYIISGRRTYVDLITKGINRSKEDDPDFDPIPDYYFYDLNAKVNFILGEKDRIFFSGYFGQDRFNFDSDFFQFNFDWGNATGTARWNHVFNSDIFVNTTATFSNYEYNINNKVTGFSFDISSKIQDIALKSDYYYNINNEHSLKFGAGLIYHQFEVGRLRAGSDNGAISFNAGQDFDGLEAGMYISDVYNPNPNLSIEGGIRLSAFFNDGTSYIRPEPRLTGRYSATPRISIKASYARMNQYLHLVSTSGLALPTDVWYPSTTKVEPQSSDQIATGWSMILGKKYFLTNEYYYKWLHNQVDFVDGASLFANDDLESEFAIGKGYSYGGELSIEKREGRLTGWIGYTLAVTKIGDFEPINPQENFGQGTAYFSPRYDRRHDISVVALFEINKRLTAGATWVYGSGDLTWLATGRTYIQDIPGVSSEAVVPLYGERNNIRLAPYHRLDLSLVWKFYPKWGESDLTFSTFNTYDRRNAFFVYLEPQYASNIDAEEVQGSEIPERIAAKQVSLFPILPSVTFNFKF